MIPRYVLIMVALSVAVFVVYLNIELDYVWSSERKAEKLARKMLIPPPIFEYAVDTAECQIPMLDPFHKSIRHLLKNFTNVKFKCDRNPQLFFTDKNVLKVNRVEMVKVRRKWQNLKCAYRPFERWNVMTFHWTKPWRPINGDIVLTDEFVEIECHTPRWLVYQDLLAVIVEKADVERRCKRASSTFDLNSTELSVLIIGVDSVSKNQYLRHLVRTDRFVRKNLNFIEFHGYNVVGDDTFDNLIPFLSGKSKPEADASVHEPFVWKLFSEQCYRTLSGEELSSFPDEYDVFVHRGQPTDYSFRMFSLATESREAAPADTRSDYCLPNRSKAEAMLKWTTDFFDKFKSERLFAFLFLSKLSHDDYNGVAFLDEWITDALTRLRNAGHLEKSAVFFFSDHGPRFGPVRMTDYGEMERRLPFLFLFLPSWFGQKHARFYENLKINEKRLVTAFDVYATLSDVAGFLRNVKKAADDDRGISLFNEIPSVRNCKMAGIEYLRCACYLIRRTQMNVADGTMREAASLFVDYINRGLAKKSACVKLSLETVINIVAGEKLESDFTKILTVTVRVNPSKAILQGIVRFNEASGLFQVDRNIDRLDLYGNQSYCVLNPRYKLICYCKDQ